MNKKGPEFIGTKGVLMMSEEEVAIYPFAFDPVSFLKKIREQSINLDGPADNNLFLKVIETLNSFQLQSSSSRGVETKNKLLQTWYSDSVFDTRIDALYRLLKEAEFTENDLKGWINGEGGEYHGSKLFKGEFNAMKQKQRCLEILREVYAT